MRKLKRSVSDSMIAGVCGGVGESFGIDSNIVRLVWVLLSITGGGGLLLYIIAALILPLDDGSDDEEF